MADSHLSESRFLRVDDRPDREGYRHNSRLPLRQHFQVLAGGNATPCGRMLPPAAAKEMGNRYRILPRGGRPVGPAGVMAMMPGMAPATVRASGGAITLRFSNQRVTVMLHSG